MTSDDLGKVTVSVRTTDITSQHLSMSISPANIPKFASFKRWNGTERKFRLTWPGKSGHRSNVIVGTDLKFSGKVWNCSTVRYTYQVSWRSADPFASYSWKTRGVASTPLCRRGLTRAWPGGGGVWRPPSRIFAIAPKRTALSTWNLAGLLIQQFDIVRGNFFEIRWKFFEIWSILWRHYTPLLVENWPNFAGLWKTQFLMKTQMKNTKRRKMRSSTRWLSRFFKILGFWPLKFQKIVFFLENDP